MLLRLRRLLDVRAGEGLPVLLAFLYVALVVAAFLLAKPLRNSLYLREYGPYALVYAYAAVPLVLWMFVPLYGAVAARIGFRLATAGTLSFFCLNVLGFWWAFRAQPFDLLPALFYIWVNCFGVIAPVQAWSFANTLFDARQAKRLFGLIGAGASFGAIAGGVMARFLVGPIGGTVNMLLVLAALIFGAAVTVGVASRRLKKRPSTSGVRRKPDAARPTIGTLFAKPYFRLLAALVGLAAIATQWTNFQLSVVADARFGSNADELTRFFGTFNFLLGAVGFVVQLLITSRLLKAFGVGAVILLLPLTIAFGSALTVVFPVFLAVLLTNAGDQSLRFSVDKAAYELLYLPIPPRDRHLVKSALDILANRIADAVGGVVLGLATGGFLMLPGAGLGIRGTAAGTFILTLGWAYVAWRLRDAYIAAIGESIHRHRIDSEQSAGQVDQSVDEVLSSRLSSRDADDVRWALDALRQLRVPRAYKELHVLLEHPAADIRRDALAVLADAGDRSARLAAEGLLRDKDLGVRTQALLYLARDGNFDPLERLQELGRFEDFSIRAGMVAFLSARGPARNEEAARLMLEQMAGSEDPRDRSEAARLLSHLERPSLKILTALIDDEDDEVARQAVRSAQILKSIESFDALLMSLGRAEVAETAAMALASLGEPAVPLLESALADTKLPLDVRREIPSALVRVGTPQAERALLAGLLDADAPLRQRVISSLNKMKLRYPTVVLDTAAIELLLAAEIAGHYRSYQVLARIGADARVVAAVRLAMEQELERIFRLIALLSPAGALHDAYVGVRSTNSQIRANALEYLDNVLKPELRAVLLPLIDSQVSEAERAALGDQLVGAPLDTPDEALATLLASADPWLRSRAEIAASRVAEHEPADAAHAPAPASMDASVGAG